MSKLSLSSTLPLSWGELALPRFGLGVYAMHGRVAREAVAAALQSGYRLLDTAQLYGNEREVGEGIKMSGVPRDEVFVVTKIYGAALGGGERTRRAARESLDRLGTYIDLMLLHNPGHSSAARLDAWAVLAEEFVDPAGSAPHRIRALGVSNFGQRQITELLASPAGQRVPPVVNEIECHVFCQQTALRAWLVAHGLAVMAYCPLGQGSYMRDATLRQVAAEVGATPAQVMLRWILQQDSVVPIPKSANPARQTENAAALDGAFALSPQQMDTLAGLDRGLAGIVDGWASYQE